MTPSRLVELKCPNCSALHWTIDSDYRGTDGVYIDYRERKYGCSTCGYSETGYTVLRQSPPEFFLQPHPMYPMKQKDFDYWVNILNTHFPDHPLLNGLGKEFRPNSQVLRTKLNNRWWIWKDKLRRKIIIARVDLEDWWHGTRKINR